MTNPGSPWQEQRFPLHPDAHFLPKTLGQYDKLGQYLVDQ
jgi:hypothetical protein